MRARPSRTLARVDGHAAHPSARALCVGTHRHGLSRRGRATHRQERFLAPVAQPRLPRFARDTQRATHAYSEAGDLQIITLYDGERFEGIPGERKFRIVRFAENTIPVRLPALSAGAVAMEGTPTRQLLSSANRAQAAEFHWRIAFPIMALVLACIAVPLARLRPRQGRYARVGYAVLIFFVYINLAIAGRLWIARGVIPAWLGLWWVHAIVILLATFILVVPKVRARARPVSAISGVSARPDLRL